MDSVQLRSGRILVLAAVALSALWLAVRSASASADAEPVSASVGTGTFGRPIAPGFVGLSVEFNALRRYTGLNPKAVNPVFVQLLRNLAPGQPFVLRIGGNSTDDTWWPLRRVTPPGGIPFPRQRAGPLRWRNLVPGPERPRRHETGFELHLRELLG